MLILNMGQAYNVNINIYCILYVNIYILILYDPMITIYDIDI
jgi:hypothetical protein